MKKKSATIWFYQDLLFELGFLFRSNFQSFLVEPWWPLDH